MITISGTKSILPSLLILQDKSASSLWAKGKCSSNPPTFSNIFLLNAALQVGTEGCPFRFSIWWVRGLTSFLSVVVLPCKPIVSFFSKASIIVSNHEVSAKQSSSVNAISLTTAYSLKFFNLPYLAGLEYLVWTTGTAS